jgi:two-component system, chemotaxis family, response regulator Rcp1
MDATSGKNIVRDVLLVDDSPGDVRLMQEVFREVTETTRLHVACDGVEALAFLRREGPHLNAPRPVLILLDLNMPRMNGREVLEHIKSDATFKKIPVVVLTTSESEEDITACYERQANSYLSKPTNLNEFESLVRSLTDFWLTKAKLPAHVEVLQ